MLREIEHRADRGQRGDRVAFAARGERAAAMAASVPPMQKPNRSTSRLAGRLLDRVRARRAGPSVEIIVEALVGELGPGIDPGDDEEGVALLDQPADQRGFGLEVEQIIFVHQRRHVEEGPLVHRLGRRRVLDELHQLVLEDDAARAWRRCPCRARTRPLARRCGSFASVAASASRLARPESRLIEPVSIARRIASGLVKAKLAGERALR